MRKVSRVATIVAAGLFLVGLSVAPVTAIAVESDHVASGIGTAKINGKDAIVEVLVIVPANKNARDEVNAALKREGATPVSNEYSFTGLVWDPPAITQNYNPSGEKIATAAALQNTHSTWNGASGSSFRFSYGGTTTRCPSLVRECPGPQTRDGFQDVGWARLGGTTLGVTWSTTNPPEADMALNTRFSWNTGCVKVSGKYDVQTVLLHENGHVMGLGHSSVQNTVMYASYSTARCALAPDDVAGAAALY